MGTLDDYLPRTWVELGAFTVATVVAVVLVRAVVGLLVGAPARPITYVGVLGGAVASVAMVAVLEVMSDVDESDLELFRTVQLAHVAYLTIAGGAYPAVMARVLGLSVDWYAALPGAVLTAIVWAEVLFVVAALVYLLVEAIPVQATELEVWLDVFLLFLLYGTVLGLVVGAWQAVWAPLLGG